MSSDPSPRIYQRLIPNVFRRSIAVKITVVLLVMGALVGAVGVLGTQQVESELRENVRTQYTNAAQGQSDVLAQWFQRNNLTTKLASRNDAWRQNDSLDAAVQEEYDGLNADLSGEVANVHVVESHDDGSFTAIASTSISEGSDLTLVNRRWVTSTEFDGSGDVAASSVYLTRAGGSVVGFMSPVPNTTDRYLLVEFTVDQIAETMRQSASDAAFTQVVNGDFRIMVDARPGGDDLTLQPYPEDAAQRIQAELPAERNGTTAGVIDRMHLGGVLPSVRSGFTVGYATVRGTNWLVLVHVQHDTAFAAVGQIRRAGIIASGAGALLIVIVGAAVGISTARSIDRLRRRTEEMREGNLDVDIGTTRVDSIGDLYGAFAAMRDALKRQIEEAESARAEAEEAREEAEKSRKQAVKMNEYLEDKAVEFGAAMEQAAGGDLTQRLETDGTSEAMDRIAEEFNHMIEELEKTTDQLKTFADEVVEAGDVVSDRAKTVADTAGDVEVAVERIAQQAADQDAALEDLGESLTALDEAFEDAADEFDDASFEDEREAIDDALSTVDAIEDAVSEIRDDATQIDGAAQSQEVALEDVTDRADVLERFGQPLSDILNRFETDAEQEFVFSGGPSQSSRSDDDEE